MLDKNGNEIRENVVVEIKDAPFVKDNGLFLVEEAISDYSFILRKLNTVMAKTKVTTRWPLFSKSRKFQNEFYTQVNAATIEVLCPYVEPEETEEDDSQDIVRFLKKGIKVHGIYYPCFYAKRDDNSISIVSKDRSKHLPNELGDVRNDSNWMFDDIRPDYCILRPGDTFYQKALSVCGE